MGKHEWKDTVYHEYVSLYIFPSSGHVAPSEWVGSTQEEGVL